MYVDSTCNELSAATQYILIIPWLKLDLVERSWGLDIQIKKSFPIVKSSYEIHIIFTLDIYMNTVG